MNDERFFDLAMKVIARQSTDAERAELDALLAREPKLKTEFDRLQADIRLAKEILPLTAATDSSTGQFPSYARERLQTKVRGSLGDAQAPTRRSSWNLRWAWGIAAGAAVILLLAMPMLKPAAPAMQVAVLDLTGAVRGSENDELKIIQQEWKEASVQRFAKTSDLDAWETNWTDSPNPVTKVIYDRAAGEVIVLFRSKGETITASFAVDKDLATSIQQVKAYLAEKAKR